MGKAAGTALQRCHSRKTKETILFGGLDAFCCGRYIEAASQGKCRRDDRGTLGSLGQVLGEGLVDLDFVEREHHQLTERRIAGSEVIKSNADSEVLELPQNRQALCRRLDDGCLGKLNFQAFRRTP